MNDDVLLLLFSHLLHLVDALHLGSTCRRLYGFYLKSCTDRRSLEIYRKPRFYSDIRSRNTFQETAADELTKANHCSVALPKEYTTTTTIDATNYTTFFIQLFVRLPNLVSLEVVDEYGSQWTFPHLLTALRSSVQLFSGRLQALTLAIDEDKQVDDEMLGPPLHLPTLKHLTLYLFNDGGQPIDQCVLNSPLFDWVLPQLASFRLYAESGNLVEMLRFIDEHFLRLANAHLATAAAAAIDASSSPSLQIALRLPDFVFNYQRWAPGEHSQALACVTSMYIDQIEPEEEEEEVENEEEGEGIVDNLHLQVLPLLAILKKVRIGLDGANADTKWYPRVLTALAKLSKLEEVFIKTYGDVPRWDRQLMPIMPKVRSLSLDFSSTYHANPVEAAHLAHCFPNLQQISVTISQGKCEFCDYRLADLGVLQECAQRISWDLQRLGTGTGWQAQVQLKKLVACFSKHKVRFNSLEDLLAGIKDAGYRGVPE